MDRNATPKTPTLFDLVGNSHAGHVAVRLRPGFGIVYGGQHVEDGPHVLDVVTANDLVHTGRASVVSAADLAAHVAALADQDGDQDDDQDDDQGDDQDDDQGDDQDDAAGAPVVTDPAASSPPATTSSTTDAGGKGAGAPGARAGRRPPTAKA